MATLQALATVEDLAGFLGEGITEDDDKVRAGWCLRVASSLVRSETRKSWTTTEDEPVTDIPESVTLVTLYCASRIYDNREARTSTGLDDFREGFKVDEAGAYLTASERNMLADHRAGRGTGIGTIGRTVVDDAGVNGWVPTDTPGVEFPWY